MSKNNTIESGHFFRLMGESEGIFKDRGSRFLAFAYPVESVEEMDSKVSGLKKRFHDARHHCYAYRLGIKGEHSYASDDGEPSHSAGDPILGVIRSADLTNILIVVVRYFGGTKLGVRGLIEAYRTAAEAAVAQNHVEAIIPKITFSIRFPYEKTSDINRILHRFETEVIASEYTHDCFQTLTIEEGVFPELRHQMELARITIDIENEDQQDGER